MLCKLTVIKGKVFKTFDFPKYAIVMSNILLANAEISGYFGEKDKQIEENSPNNSIFGRNFHNLPDLLTLDITNEKCMLTEKKEMQINIEHIEKIIEWCILFSSHDEWSGKAINNVRECLSDHKRRKNFVIRAEKYGMQFTDSSEDPYMWMLWDSILPFESKYFNINLWPDICNQIKGNSLSGISRRDAYTNFGKNIGFCNKQKKYNIFEMIAVSNKYGVLSLLVTLLKRVSFKIHNNSMEKSFALLGFPIDQGALSLMQNDQNEIYYDSIYRREIEKRQKSRIYRKTMNTFMCSMCSNREYYVDVNSGNTDNLNPKNGKKILNPDRNRNFYMFE